MVAMNTDVLENLFKAKLQTPFVEETLGKLIQDQISQEELALKRLMPRLLDFEKKYGMSSSSFFSLYGQGKLGDEMDYFEWNVLYKMRLDSERRIAILEGTS